MIACHEMLVGPAKEAGIEVPPNPRDYDKDRFARWHLFLAVQLGAPLPYWCAHWDNAKVVARVPEDKLQTVTLEDLRGVGLAVDEEYHSLVHAKNNALENISHARDRLNHQP